MEKRVQHADKILNPESIPSLDPPEMIHGSFEAEPSHVVYGTFLNITPLPDIRYAIFSEPGCQYAVKGRFNPDPKRLSRT